MKTIKAPAKINLTLDITGKRADGYHTLESVFQTINIYDTVTVTANNGEGIVINVNSPGIPTDENNTAHIAAKLFCEYVDIPADFTISVEKKIPQKAGLGGGSSDAAAVLKCLNEISGKNLPVEELINIAMKVGADVPFFLYGGTCYVTGAGEQIEVLPPLPTVSLVVLKGVETTSTSEAYARFDASEFGDAEIHLKNSVNPENAHTISSSCRNIFELVLDNTSLQGMQDALEANGALCGRLTGTGSAVYGIFDDKDKAKRAADILKNRFVFSEYAEFTQGLY